MTAPDPETRPAPTNVVAALSRVMEDMPGIGREQRSEQGYNYRGIEAITREAQPILARYGVVFVPRVVARFTKDLTINSKPWTEEQLTVMYRVYGPDGTQDYIDVGPIVALGRDNSDKGCNKAMTQAYKYALIQTLCIGDAKDDADQHRAAEADAKGPTVRDRASALEGAARGVFGSWLVASGISTKSAEWTDDHLKQIEGWLDHLAQTGEARMDRAEAASESPGSGAGEAESADARAERLEPPADPENVSERPRGQAAPAPTEDVLEGFDPKRLNEIIATVQGMAAKDVDKALTHDHRLPVEGNADARRRLLTYALVAAEKSGATSPVAGETTVES